MERGCIEHTTGRTSAQFRVGIAGEVPVCYLLVSCMAEGLLERRLIGRGIVALRQSQHDEFDDDLKKLDEIKSDAQEHARLRYINRLNEAIQEYKENSDTSRFVEANRKLLSALDADLNRVGSAG